MRQAVSPARQHLDCGDLSPLLSTSASLVGWDSTVPRAKAPANWRSPNAGAIHGTRSKPGGRELSNAKHIPSLCLADDPSRRHVELPQCLEARNGKGKRELSQHVLKLGCQGSSVRMSMSRRVFAYLGARFALFALAYLSAAGA